MNHAKPNKMKPVKHRGRRVANGLLWFVHFLTAKCFPAFLWFGCVAILATVLLAALAGILKSKEANPWAIVPAPEIEGSPWPEVMRAYAEVDDIPGAIALIETRASEADRIFAVESLIRAAMAGPSAVLETQRILAKRPADYDKPLTEKAKTSAPEQTKVSTVEDAMRVTEEIRRRMDEDEAKERAAVVKRLLPAEEYLDTLPRSSERTSAYALLAKLYSTLKADRREVASLNQVNDSLLAFESRSWPSQSWQHICDWFRPFLHEQIVVFLCGIMVGAVFMLRPTASIGSKALAYWFFGRFKGKCVRKALGEKLDDQADEGSD